jgi:ABC-type antimicrobial peptide transport system permease subunit
VEKIERRLTFPGIIKRAGTRPMMAVMTFLETPAPDIHSFQFIAGRPFQADELNAVVIERTLTVHHGYRVGDTLEVKVGEKIYDSRIVGLAISPEYFVSTSNPDYFIPEKGSLGVVFGNLNRVSDSLGFTIVNDLLFRFHSGVNAAAVKQDILHRLSKLNIEQVIPQERHFSYEYIQTELGALQFFIPAMVIILLALAFIITLINFHRMVAAERRAIGALMALGYDRWALLRSYLEGSLMLGFLGSLLGLALSFLLRDLFANRCAESIGMPLVWLAIDFITMVKGFIYGLLVALVSAAIPVLRLLQLSPQQVIRESRRLIESPQWSLKWLSPRLLKLPASYRYGLRNLLRQRGRTTATLASIALALGVATAYRMSAGSIDETLVRRFENDQWQLTVDFLYPVFLEDIEELKRMPQVKRIEPYFRRYVEVEKDGRFEDSALLGIDPNSRMEQLYLAGGRGPRSGHDQEIVLSLQLARKLRAKIGDVVNVHVLNQAHPFRLVGLSSDVVAGPSIVPFQVAQEVCQFPEKASGLYLQTDSPSAPLSEELYRREFVGKVVEKSQLLDQIRMVISVMITVLDIAAGISIFVAVLFILTSINLSVLETEGEFATLKAIGYGQGSITRIIFTETLAYAIGATLLSIPVAVIISVYLNHRMGQAWFRVDNFFFPLEFAKVLLPALVLIPFGGYPGMRHIFHLDISQAIRTRVIE